MKKLACAIVALLFLVLSCADPGVHITSQHSTFDGECAHISGRVENRFSYTVKRAHVEVQILDSNGQVVKYACVSISPEELRPGDTGTFGFTSCEIGAREIRATGAVAWPANIQ